MGRRHVAQQDRQVEPYELAEGEESVKGTGSLTWRSVQLGVEKGRIIRTHSIL